MSHTEQMRDALEALAKRGTHFDTCPTRRLPSVSTPEEVDAFWSQYMADADAQVRKIAQAALAAPAAEPEQSTRLRGGVPEGFALVPLKPTEEMRSAGKKQVHGESGAMTKCDRMWKAMLTAAPQAPALDAGVVRDARAEFEAMNRDSHGFKRSPRGTYRNPPVARDWKWFQAGIDFAKKGGQR